MIITLAEYKTFPAYSTNQSDDIVNNMIASIDQDIVNVRGKALKTSTGDITTGSAIVTDIDNISGIKLYDFYRSTNLVGTVIAIDDSSVTLDTVATGTATEEIFYTYPSNLKRIASEMINYNIEVYTGITVESIEDHSVDYGDMIFGYPESIVGKIKRYL
jgi:hypothetical protein